MSVEFRSIFRRLQIRRKIGLKCDGRRLDDNYLIREILLWNRT